mmetsp:Transcript_638/g.1010  ORF Transcript_638/g.1010 Transcript_638/m.1010 type:complete len:451 (-) Transcript_638:410-1762(-)
MSSSSVMYVSDSSTTWNSNGRARCRGKSKFRGRSGCTCNFNSGVDVDEDSEMDLQSTTLTSTSTVFSSSTCTLSSSTVTSTTLNGTNASTTLSSSTTITVSSTFYSFSSSTTTLSGGSTLSVTQMQMSLSTITISDSSSTLAVEGTANTQVAVFGASSAITGNGRLGFRRGRFSVTSSSLLVALILSSASSAFDHQRSLLQTDLTTTSPAVSGCGSVVSGSSLTIGSGASLDVDISCTYGTETWNIFGTSSTYTTSALANGNVDVQSGGLLVLSSITGSPNAFSINGTLTLSGSMEVIVSAAGDGTTVTLMKWDSSTCTDITGSITVYGCSNCTLNVTYSTPAASCYLQMTFGNASVAADDNDELLYLLFLLLLLIPITGAICFFAVKKATGPKAAAMAESEYPVISAGAPQGHQYPQNALGYAPDAFGYGYGPTPAGAFGAPPPAPTYY